MRTHWLRLSWICCLLRYVLCYNLFKVPNIWVNVLIFPHLWEGRYLYMTLQLLHSDYLWGKVLKIIFRVASITFYAQHSARILRSVLYDYSLYLDLYLQ
jgi:hypothetical protein